MANKKTVMKIGDIHLACPADSTLLLYMTDAENIMKESKIYKTAVRLIGSVVKAGIEKGFHCSPATKISTSADANSR